MNMAESSSYDYEEILLKDIEDSKVKCVLVLEHFTFEKSQVRIVLQAFYRPQNLGSLMIVFNLIEEKYFKKFRNAIRIL